MKLFLRSQTVLPRLARCFSSTRRAQGGSVTVAVPASADKNAVLDKFKHSRSSFVLQHGTQSSGPPDNAAVVLVSPGLAAWLEDDAFMASLLRQLPLAPAPDGSLSVLAAVVDGLATAPTGLSILHGRADTLLPGLWKDAPGDGNVDADAAAAISFALPSIRKTDGRSSSLRVTLPLANTVFQNGRRSTLLASRWDDSVRRWTRECTHQLVVPDCVAPTAATVPLLAVTEPRTIATGLGNIVRQVLRDGKPSPASLDLESAMPALLAARRKAWPGVDYDAETAVGALGVWGLAVPPPAQALYEQVRAALAPTAEHTPAAEQAAAARASPELSALLAGGCRLHRILSGGGGWGQKQGLLSLDPQMAHPATSETAPSDDDDDAAMASFMRSLQGASEDQGDNLATPGAYIQFFVAPLDGSSTAGIPCADAIALGAVSEDSHPVAEQPLSLFPGRFGAVSHQGIFLGGPEDEIYTKVDAPHAFVWNRQADA